jgi:hypothetical protein
MAVHGREPSHTRHRHNMQAHSNMVLLAETSKGETSGSVYNRCTCSWNSEREKHHHTSLFDAQRHASSLVWSFDSILRGGMQHQPHSSKPVTPAPSLIHHMRTGSSKSYEHPFGSQTHRTCLKTCNVRPATPNSEVVTHHPQGQHMQQPGDACQACA